MRTESRSTSGTVRPSFGAEEVRAPAAIAPIMADTNPAPPAHSEPYADNKVDPVPQPQPPNSMARLPLACRQPSRGRVPAKSGTVVSGLAVSTNVVWDSLRQANRAPSHGERLAPTHTEVQRDV